MPLNLRCISNNTVYTKYVYAAGEYRDIRNRIIEKQFY